MLVVLLSKTTRIYTTNAAEKFPFILKVQNPELSNLSILHFFKILFECTKVCVMCTAYRSYSIRLQNTLKIGKILHSH